MARSEADRARARLRGWLAAFFLALALPGGLLVYTAYDQLKWESFRRQQLLAEDLAASVDRRLSDFMRVEEARAPEDYGFLLAPGAPGSGDLRPSPLAVYPASERFPGLVGWFEVGEDGGFGTPWVPGVGISPAAYGIGSAELAQRQAGARRIEGVLVGNRLVETAAPAGEALGETAERESPGRAAVTPPAPAALSQTAKAEVAAEPQTRLSQAAFERLAEPTFQGSDEERRSGPLRRADELAPESDLARRQRPSRDEPLRDAPAPAGSPAGADAAGGVSAKPSEVPSKGVLEPTLRDGTGLVGNQGPVSLFNAAREPFRFGRLDSGHLLLFRRAQRAGERVVQGILIDQGPFLSGLLGEPFAASPLAASADLGVAYRGALLVTVRAQGPEAERLASRAYEVPAQELRGELLYRTRLLEPFGALELIFSVRRLPSPPGAAAIGAIAVTLVAILIGGTWLLGRLGGRQIALASQQQAFVSAVSHELKTPLTSIRMYAEMLRAGFADEPRRATYYRYIQEESERLSRLIANVLQLSRINRGQLQVEVRPVAVGELMDAVRDRIAGPAERAGFRLNLRCPDSGLVMADPDAFVQVLINLVDNAIKFAAGSEPKVVEIGCRRQDPARWCFWVRDFGPGIPRASRRRVFQLFYRGPEAQSQAVPGTGIGLALVQELTRAMGGTVKLVEPETGAEFRLELRAAGRRAQQRQGPTA
jgi:signal transduction histidine kinase